MHEESIFAAALEKLTPVERAAYLKGACAGDPGLHRRVEALLKAHEQSGDLLDPPADVPGPIAFERLSSAFADQSPTQPVAERPGVCIGPYRLLQPIGEGGMGVVFMAEQEMPVRRTVALKVIKPGMDTA